MEDEEEGKERERNSKDSRINKEEKILVKGVREKGQIIMNSRIEGDNEEVGRIWGEKESHRLYIRERGDKKEDGIFRDRR